MQTKHANAVVCISLLGYPASDVDGIDLYEIPHLVIWPVELQQHCHSISSSKKSKVAQAAHANSEKQYGWVCRSHLCLASFQCRRYVSIYKQSACWQWCICCLCITGPVALLHLRHSIGPHHQLLSWGHNITMQHAQKHALPLQRYLHLGLCSLAQLAFAWSIRLEGEAWCGLTELQQLLPSELHGNADAINYIECSFRWKESDNSMLHEVQYVARTQFESKYIGKMAYGICSFPFWVSVDFDWPRCSACDDLVKCWLGVDIFEQLESACNKQVVVHQQGRLWYGWMRYFVQNSYLALASSFAP
jgi:hypothetical protein